MSQDDDQLVERVAMIIAKHVFTERASEWPYAGKEEEIRGRLQRAARAALSAMPSRLSPELIAQLTALASRLTQMGEYEAVDLIDTVVARVTAMPGRELLAEALEALDGMLFFVGELPGAQYSAHVHAASAAADKIRDAMGGE